MTFAWRRTACRMRHCFARRIVETGGRRKLGCTATRSAERHPQGVCRIRKAAKLPTAAQQRIIEAEADRVAVLTRQRRAQEVASASIAALRAACSQCQSLSLGVPKGIFSFAKENIPFDSCSAKGAAFPPLRSAGAKAAPSRCIPLAPVREHGTMYYFFLG